MLVPSNKTGKSLGGVVWGIKDKSGYNVLFELIVKHSGGGSLASSLKIGPTFRRAVSAGVGDVGIFHKEVIAAVVGMKEVTKMGRTENPILNLGGAQGSGVVRGEQIGMGNERTTQNKSTDSLKHF